MLSRNNDTTSSATEIDAAESLVQVILAVRQANGRIKQALKNLNDSQLDEFNGHKLTIAIKGVCQHIGCNRLDLNVSEEDVMKGVRHYFTECKGLTNNGKLMKTPSLTTEEAKAFGTQKTEKVTTSTISRIAETKNNIKQPATYFQSLSVEQQDISSGAVVKTEVKEFIRLTPVGLSHESESFKLKSNSASPPAASQVLLLHQQVSGLSQSVKNKSNIDVKIGDTTAQIGVTGTVSRSGLTTSGSPSFSPVHPYRISDAVLNSRHPKLQADHKQLIGSRITGRIHNNLKDFYDSFWRKVFFLFYIVSVPSSKTALCLWVLSDIVFFVESHGSLFISPIVAMAMDIVVQRAMYELSDKISKSNCQDQASKGEEKLLVLEYLFNSSTAFEIIKSYRSLDVEDFVRKGPFKTLKINSESNGSIPESGANKSLSPVSVDDQSLAELLRSASCAADIQYCVSVMANLITPLCNQFLQDYFLVNQSNNSSHAGSHGSSHHGSTDRSSEKHVFPSPSISPNPASNAILPTGFSLVVNIGERVQTLTRQLQELLSWTHFPGQSKAEESFRMNTVALTTNSKQAYDSNPPFRGGSPSELTMNYDAFYSQIEKSDKAVGNSYSRVVSQSGSDTNRNMHVPTAANDCSSNIQKDFDKHQHVVSQLDETFRQALHEMTKNSNPNPNASEVIRNKILRCLVQNIARDVNVEMCGAVVTQLHDIHNGETFGGSNSNSNSRVNFHHHNAQMQVSGGASSATELDFVAYFAPYDKNFHHLNLFEKRSQSALYASQMSKLRSLELEQSMLEETLMSATLKHVRACLKDLHQVAIETAGKIKSHVSSNLSSLRGRVEDKHHHHDQSNSMHTVSQTEGLLDLQDMIQKRYAEELDIIEKCGEALVVAVVEEKNSRLRLENSNTFYEFAKSQNDLVESVGRDESERIVVVRKVLKTVEKLLPMTIGGLSEVSNGGSSGGGMFTNVKAINTKTRFLQLKFFYSFDLPPHQRMASSNQLANGRNRNNPSVIASSQTGGGNGYNCSLIVQTVSPIQSTDLVLAYISLDETGKVKDFLHLIKSFAKSHKIADSSQGYLGSFAWIVLALHVLLHFEFLPNIHDRIIYRKENDPNFSQSLPNPSLSHPAIRDKVRPGGISTEKRRGVSEVSPIDDKLDLQIFRVDDSLSHRMDPLHTMPSMPSNGDFFDIHELKSPTKLQSHYMRYEHIEKLQSTSLLQLMDLFFRYYSEDLDIYTSVVTLRGKGDVLQKSDWPKSPILWRMSIEDPFDHITSMHPFDLGSTLSRPGQLTIFKALRRAVYGIHSMILLGQDSNSNIKTNIRKFFSRSDLIQLARKSDYPGAIIIEPPKVPLCWMNCYDYYHERKGTSTDSDDTMVRDWKSHGLSMSHDEIKEHRPNPSIASSNDTSDKLGKLSHGSTPSSEMNSLDRFTIQHGQTVSPNELIIGQFRIPTASAVGEKAQTVTHVHLQVPKSSNLPSRDEFLPVETENAPSFPSRNFASPISNNTSNFIIANQQPAFVPNLVPGLNSNKRESPLNRNVQPNTLQPIPFNENRSPSQLIDTLHRSQQFPSTGLSTGSQLPSRNGHPGVGSHLEPLAWIDKELAAISDHSPIYSPVALPNSPNIAFSAHRKELKPSTHPPVDSQRFSSQYSLQPTMSFNKLSTFQEPEKLDEALHHPPATHEYVPAQSNQTNSYGSSSNIHETYLESTDLGRPVNRSMTNGTSDEFHRIVDRLTSEALEMSRQASIGGSDQPHGMRSFSQNESESSHLSDGVSMKNAYLHRSSVTPVSTTAMPSEGRKSSPSMMFHSPTLGMFGSQSYHSTSMRSPTPIGPSGTISSTTQTPDGIRGGAFGNVSSLANTPKSYLSNEAMLSSSRLANLHYKSNPNPLGTNDLAFPEQITSYGESNDSHISSHWPTGREGDSMMFARQVSSQDRDNHMRRLQEMPTLDPYQAHRQGSDGTSADLQYNRADFQLNPEAAQWNHGSDPGVYDNFNRSLISATPGSKSPTENQVLTQYHHSDYHGRYLPQGYPPQQYQDFNTIQYRQGVAPGTCQPTDEFQSGGVAVEGQVGVRMGSYQIDNPPIQSVQSMNGLDPRHQMLAPTLSLFQGYHQYPPHKPQYPQTIQSLQQENIPKNSHDHFDNYPVDRSNGPISTSGFNNQMPSGFSSISFQSNLLYTTSRGNSYPDMNQQKQLDNNHHAQHSNSQFMQHQNLMTTPTSLPGYSQSATSIHHYSQPPQPAFYGNSTTANTPTPSLFSPSKSPPPLQQNPYIQNINHPQFAGWSQTPSPVSSSTATVNHSSTFYSNNNQTNHRLAADSMRAPSLSNWTPYQGNNG